MQGQSFRSVLTGLLALLRDPLALALLAATIALTVGVAWLQHAAMSSQPFGLLTTLGPAVLQMVGFAVIGYGLGYVLLADMRGGKTDGVVRYIGLYILYLLAFGIIAAIVLGGFAIALGFGASMQYVAVVVSMLTALLLFPALVRLKLLAADIEEPRLGTLFGELFSALLPHLVWIVLLTVPLGFATVALFGSTFDTEPAAGGLPMLIGQAAIAGLSSFIQEAISVVAARQLGSSPASEAAVFE